MQEELIETLGRAGEDCLRKLTRTGFIVTKPGDDAKGWDFILEPKKDLDGLKFPLEGPRPAKILVQCKAFAVYPSDPSKDDPKRRSIELDHWIRAVNDHNPWFFLIVEVNAETEDFEPMQAYLVHVGEKWIERLSERIFKSLEAEGDPSTKGTMDLRWESSERLPDLNPSTFNVVVKMYLNEDMDRYALQKMLLRKRAGFEKYTLRLGVVQQSDEKALVDYLLGYSPLTTLERYVEEQRFGKARTVMHLGPGPVPTVGVAVKLRLSDSDDEVCLTGSAFTTAELEERCGPDGAKLFPAHRAIVRLAAEPFEIVHVDGKSTTSIAAVQSDGRLRLQSAATAHRLMQMFNPSGSDGGKVRMYVEDMQAHRLNFVDKALDGALTELQREQRHWAGLQGALGVAQDDQSDEVPASVVSNLRFGVATPRSRGDERVIWLLSARCVQIWQKIAPKVMIPDITCHFGDLLDQREEIMILATLLGFETQAFEMTMSAAQKFELPEKPWIPTVMGLQLGPNRLWAAGFLQANAQCHSPNADGRHRYTIEHVGGDYVIGKVGALTMSAQELIDAAAHLRTLRARHSMIMEANPSIYLAEEFPVLTSMGSGTPANPTT